MRTLMVVVSLLLATPLAAAAQAQEVEAERPGSGWTVATSATYPMVRIYQVHVSRALSDWHEVFFGPAYQNFTSGSVNSHAYTLVLGHRYYLRRGLHVESEWWPAYNSMHSTVTDQRYPGVELWAEVKVGYKPPIHGRWFIQPSPGVGFGILRTNRPPGFEDLRSPIFVPQLKVGLQL